MKFAQPIWLIIGAVILVTLVVLRIWLTRRKNRELNLFAAERLIPQLTRGISVTRRRIKTALLLIGIAALFVALARPQWGSRREEVSMQGIDILIALDTSRSMLASDVSPNRLDQSKLAIHDFTSSLTAARIGLLPFAGDAFLLCPLTLDRDAFSSSLNDLDTDIVAEGGTNIARAITEAEKVFEKGSNQKILVLITDGEDLEGGAIDAARQAAKNGITIHTVGVGTPAGNLILLGNGRPLTDNQGKAVRSKLDEKTLGELASITGGMYAPLVGDIAGLEKIRRNRLDKVTKSELESQTKEIPIERYCWPLSLGLVLLALEFCIGSATRRNRTQTATAAALLILVAAPDLQASGAGSDPRVVYNEGTELWKKGNFSEAEQKFHDALSSADLTLQNQAYYNLGNTRYRLGQEALKEGNDAKKTTTLWEQAIEAYDAALKLAPNDKDASYNKDLVQKKLDELKQKQPPEDQKKQDDKKDQKDQKNEEKKEDQDKKDQSDKNDQSSEDQQKEQQGSDDKKKSSEQNKSDPEKQDNEQEPKEGQPDQKNDQGKEEENQGSESDQEKGQEPKEGNQTDQQAQPNPEERVPGKMTKEEAKRLLESLTEEEGKIRIAAPRRPDKPGQPRQAKRDW